MGKGHQIYMLDDFHEKLKEIAKEKEVSISELVVKTLQKSFPQLNK